MTESTQDLLSKAEDALWSGDRRAAGLLLHNILLQDFTNDYAWRLLHAMLGAGQPFEQFQQAFAQKNYPHQAHLLHQPPAPAPEAPAPSAPEPASLSTAPLSPAALSTAPLSPAPLPPAPLPPAPPDPDAELSHTAPFSPEHLPYALLPDLSCPVCGAACLPQATFCRYCGLPFTTVPQTLTGTGSLLLIRPKSHLARDRAFSIWIDNKQQEQIMDDEQRLLTLPAGPHALTVKSHGQASAPLQVYIKPSTRVRLICHPATAPLRGAAPEIKVIPYRESAIPRHVPTRGERVWSFIRMLLIILLVSGFIGMIVYIAFYMIWN